MNNNSAGQITIDPPQPSSLVHGQLDLHRGRATYTWSCRPASWLWLPLQWGRVYGFGGFFATTSKQILYMPQEIS